METLRTSFLDLAKLTQRRAYGPAAASQLASAALTVMIFIHNEKITELPGSKLQYLLIYYVLPCAMLARGGNVRVDICAGFAALICVGKRKMAAISFDQILERGSLNELKVALYDRALVAEDGRASGKDFWWDLGIALDHVFERGVTAGRAIEADAAKDRAFLRLFGLEPDAH